MVKFIIPIGNGILLAEGRAIEALNCQFKTKI